MYHESIGHLHVHTSYSDGAKLHADIARDAIAAGLDFLIITDHNVWVEGLEGYYGDEKEGKVLMLVGEEVHDVRRRPQANHSLVFGAEREMAPFADDPQHLIDTTNETGGFCFLAHPFEIGSTVLKGGELAPLGWEDWEVDGYAGLEIWNYMSEFKSHLSGKVAAIRAAFQPQRYISGPFRKTMEKWDELLASGRRIACIGGGDAHGKTYHLGQLKRTLFPYSFLFRALNTHILTKALNGDLERDKRLVLTALRQGNGWVGYDGIGATNGFRFTAQALKKQATMGDVLQLRKGGVTFQVTSPGPGHIRLLRHGQVLAETAEGPHLMYQTDEPGAYRVEVFTRFAGKKRGWIYSNPIYIRSATRH